MKSHTSFHSPIPQGIPSTVATSERVPRALRSTSSVDAADDVFCLVKSELRSPTLCQDPLLVFPSTLMAHSAQFLHRANTTKLIEPQNFDEERSEEIRKLCFAINRDFPSMRRAVSWYKTLLERTPDSPQDPYPQLTFLRNAPAEGERWHEFTLGARPLPPKPHNLQVVFHRC